MPYYWYLQKQSSGGVLRKKCYENMEQSYRRIPIPKCDLNTVASNFIEITLRHGCFPINLLHIFRTPFPKNTFGRLLLKYYGDGKVVHLNTFKALCLILNATML